jgi:hypothetical protein
LRGCISYFFSGETQFILLQMMPQHNRHIDAPLRELKQYFQPGNQRNTASSPAYLQQYHELKKETFPPIAQDTIQQSRREATV